MSSGGKPTASKPDVRKAKHERKYGLKRQLTTIANRRRKRAKHIKTHPNDEVTKKLLQ